MNTQENTNKIMSLKNTLTENQLKIIETIWNYYVEHFDEKEEIDRYISKVELFKIAKEFGLNRQMLNECIEGFSGSILFERNDKGDSNPSYCLQHLGPFLTPNGTKIKDLVIKCLEHLKNKLDTETGRSTPNVKFHEVCSVLEFTDQESKLLKIALSKMGLHNLLSLTGEVLVVVDPVELLDVKVDELEELFEQRLPNYDRSMPINALKQSSYSENKGKNALPEVNLPKPSIAQNPPKKQKDDKDNKETFKSFFREYRVEEKIGNGGNGIVYKVLDEDNKKYALKLFKKTKDTPTEKLKRFKNETYFCLKSKHNNIVEVLDFGHKVVDDIDCYFYVMPVYSGTLEHLMAKGIAPEKVLDYFLQLLDAIEEAHRQDIWHRDLKPENILYDSDNDKLMVGDFGIAHFTEEFLITVIETKANDKIGNFQYAAPEQRKKGSKVDHKADIFALALILNQMFTGDVPQGSYYKKISEISSDHSYLDEIFQRMHHQSPDSRFQSIGEIREEILAKSGKRSSLTALTVLDLGVNSVIENSRSLQEPVVGRVGFDNQSKGYNSLYTLDGHRHAKTITQMAWSPDGQLFAAGFDGVDSIWVWDVLTRELVYELPGRGESVTSIVWLPVSKSNYYLATGYMDGHLRVWEVTTERTFDNREGTAHSKAITKLYLTDDAKNLISLEDGGGIFIWYLPGKPFAHSVWAENMYLARYISGKKAFVVAEGKGVKYWPMSGEVPRKLGVQPANITAMVSSYDFKEAAVGSEDGLIRLWNLEKDRNHDTVLKHNAKILHLEYLKNDEFILSKSADNFIEIWNRSTKETIVKYESPSDSQYCIGVALHPTDPNILALLKSPKTIEVISLDLK